jgi:perosamine synthetase
MTEISGAIGKAQIEKLDDFNQRRIENALKLSRMISDLPALVPQAVVQNVKHIYYQYTVTLNQEETNVARNELQEKLARAGIETDVHWPLPIHLQPWYRETFGYKEGMFPHAEKLAKTALSLPIHPAVTGEQIEFISEELHKILR